MKKIGLIGGTGPESTILYYKELTKRIDKLTNGTEMPEIAIESINLHKAFRLVVSQRFDELTEYLLKQIRLLELGGSEVIALTAGTMHIVFDRLSESYDLVSIPKAVCEEAKARGYKKVGLLGTNFTMDQDYMKKDLREAGIDVFVPEKSDRELVAKRILEELEHGIVKDRTLQEFLGIIDRMKESYGIESVILGCTELPLLLNSEKCCCLDSVDIHINKIISLAIN